MSDPGRIICCGFPMLQFQCMSKLCGEQHVNTLKYCSKMWSTRHSHIENVNFEAVIWVLWKVYIWGADLCNLCQMNVKVLMRYVYHWFYFTLPGPGFISYCLLALLDEMFYTLFRPKHNTFWIISCCIHSLYNICYIYVNNIEIPKSRINKYRIFSLSILFT